MTCATRTQLRRLPGPLLLVSLLFAAVGFEQGTGPADGAPLGTRDPAQPEVSAETLQGAVHLGRHAFARAMAKIKKGTPARDVLALLGKPDDVRPPFDPGVIGSKKIREFWSYGTNGHRTFPTLGGVFIDTDGKTNSAFGGQGTPPAETLFAEDELRALLRLIDRAPELNGRRYDPLPVIQIVNTLQPLGKEKALAAIEEYLRVDFHYFSGARQGLFLVLRVLFDVPEDPGSMPRMYVDAPWPPEPKDPKHLPRFPVLLVEDVPVNLVSGYSLAGTPQDVEDHLVYFREHGRLRARPLVPTNDPLGVLEKCRAPFQNAYTELPPADVEVRRPSFEACEWMLKNQLLRLVDSVYRRETDRDGYKFSYEEDEAGGWKWLAAEFATRDVRWDRRKNCYTFKDGSTRSPVPVKHDRRQIWELDSVRGEATLILERCDRRHVFVYSEWTHDAGMMPVPYESSG